MEHKPADKPPRRVPAQFASLFWDCNLATLDVDLHREQILERVLELGGLEEVRWSLDTYGDDEFIAYLRGYGRERLSKDALSFWYCYYGLGEPQCTKRSLRTTNAVLWPY